MKRHCPPLSRLSSLATLFFFLLTFYGCQPLPQKKTLLTPSSGAKLFRSKCSKCHDPELALQENRSADAWRKTILRMNEEHFSAISSEEIELLVKYHMERQNLPSAFSKNVSGNASPQPLEHTATISPREMFLEKCSSCHQPARALGLFKDPGVWAKTIKRMQYYSVGKITDAEVDILVEFLVTEQQREQDFFQETCTKCHDLERINSRSMSDEQWLETIKRMQLKAPAQISAENINLLAAYLHRREFTLAKIFYGRCNLCHLGSTTTPGYSSQLDSLRAHAKKEFGQSLQIPDVENILSIHVQRQNRTMQLYENNCSSCHPEKLYGLKKSDKIRQQGRSRNEWLFFISRLQGLELSTETKTTVNTQINFHIARQ